VVFHITGVFVFLCLCVCVWLMCVCMCVWFRQGAISSEVNSQEEKLSRMKVWISVGRVLMGKAV